MKIKESSEISLYANTDITRDVQIAFNSREAQSAYFLKKRVWHNADNNKFSYLRRNNRIKVELNIGAAMKCDYISFTNPSFENKVYYARITNVEYISNRVTQIEYAIDNFQTYMFDVKYGWAKIEREHLSQSDYIKSVKNPYDPTIYEFQTSENLPSTRDLERLYTSQDVFNFPTFNASNSSHKAVFMYIADFDTSEFSNIENEFYHQFNTVIDSSGKVIYTTYTGIPDTLAGVRIGRGYGIYQIDLDGTNGMSRFKKSLDWLTAQGLNDQVIGVYQTTMGLWSLYLEGISLSLSSRNLQTISFGAPALNVESGKLYLSPYRYIRVYNNEGDCKEYKYEKFSALQLESLPSNPGQVEFAFLPLFDGSPMTSCMPVDYMKVTPESLNSEERIDCHQIPQVGYVTDAYLAFIASQMNMNIASRTNNVSEAVNSLIDSRMRETQQTGENVFTSAALGAGRATMPYVQSMIGSVSGTKSTGQAAMNVASSIGDVPLADMRNETVSWRSGFNYESSVLGPAKSAFVNDEYHPGSTNGTLGEYLLTPRTAGVFTIERVELHPTILKVYDEFFKGYGYASNRIGVPRVCDYINGGSDTPHFSSFQGKNITYVKTSSMNVEHNLANVCRDIEDMFNSGIQFLKGEDL